MPEGYIHSLNSVTFSIPIIFLCIILFPVYKLISFQIPHDTELEKCPECFGSNMCSCFRDNEFKLNWNYFWTNLLNICLNKNVLFGRCGNQIVVLKWLKDKRDVMGIMSEHLTEKNLNIDKVIQDLQTRPNESYTSVKDFIICPSSENFKSLMEPIVTRNIFNTPRTELYHYLFYSVQVNMGIIIQQITDHWAVARYLGACGDISVSAYCGHSLTSTFPKLLWEERCSITKQLLNFALNTTFDNPAFAFYFTDLSPDNFAVSDENEIRLVDLDNVIVVDKNPSDKPDNWDTVHTSYHDENIRGFAFSTEEICSHRISDTNVYSICQGILSVNSELLPGGLLHSAPPHMIGLNKLVEDCIAPATDQSRFDAAQSILQVLDKTPTT